MAKYTGPVCRLCRREGVKLFLKGDRCYTGKCAMEKRAYVPGSHGQGRQKKPTEYKIRLREKNKLRSYYGMLEKQFRIYFAEANRRNGVTGEELLQILETRLDNTVYRMGFASSRNEARQLVNHGHFTVNGKKVNIPSYLVKENDVVSVRSKSRSSAKFKSLSELAATKTTPEWITTNAETMEGTVTRLPIRSDIDLEVQERLIVELYSR